MRIHRCFLALVLLLAGVARGEDEFKITPDVVYGHKAGMALTFDVIQPKKPNGAAVLFMMSGGWFSFWVPPETFVDAQATSHFQYFGQLVDRGYTLFIVRHGSAPQFKVPEAVADVRRAVRYIRHNAKKFDIEPNRIGVCGGSAGGHLSLMLGTTSDGGNGDSEDAVDQTSNDVAAVVAYFPPVDIREWVGPNKQFPALEFDPKLADSVSPLLHVTPDDPPTLLVHGDKDELVKLNNSERILAAFEKEKVPCELLVIKDAGHGFAGEGGQQATDALIAWFDKYLAAAEAVEKAESASAAAQ
jgi:acetyl esterase/lipase